MDLASRKGQAVFIRLRRHDAHASVRSDLHRSDLAYMDEGLRTGIRLDPFAGSNVPSPKKRLRSNGR